MVASAGRGSSRVPALAKYEVLEELGHGGMATVYRAHDKRLARDVAVKVLHPHLKESLEIAHRFAAEAKAVAKLRHPNIVEVFDVSSEDEAEQYLVVEFVRGETLRKLLQRRGALPPEVGAALALELLSALAHAHAGGVVHRDVKPENVLLEHRAPGTPTSHKDTLTPVPASPPPSLSSHSRRTPDTNRGERVIVKLTDFGIAKLLDAQGVTSTGQVLGSPAHMAPEQIEGGDVDGRADVFGLGVLLYECMVGHLPFEGNNPAQVLRRVLDGIYPTAEREKPTVGKLWSQILDKALARKPEGRFDDAVSFRDAIKEELARLGITAPRTELEAWFDDPDVWEEEHQKRLIGKLCDLGAAARKQGDAVAAAADYNRALAYAPNDPQLLRIVTSMHRAEARMRLVKRAGPLFFATLGLGTTAYFVASHFKVQPLRDTPSLVAPRDSLAIGPAVPIQPTTPSGGASVVPPPDKSVAVVPSMAHARDAAIVTNGKDTKRTITIGSVQPIWGVYMSIDNGAPVEVSAGYTFDLDIKQHGLTFTCRGDSCEHKAITIAAGDSGESLGALQLSVRPAKLTIDGEPGHFYGIEEIPGLTLSSGVMTEIPMSAGSRSFTVYDHSDRRNPRSVTLTANAPKTWSFKK